MSIITDTGYSLEALGLPAGQHVDGFHRPNSDRPGAVWSDAADYWPDQFDGCPISDEQVSAQATHTPTPPDGDQLVGHQMIARDLGVDETTDWSVAITWDARSGLALAQQVSPCAFIDLESSDPLQMGVLPVYDVSIDATYFQNAFRSATTADALDPDYYDNLGGSSSAYSGSATIQTLEMRCVSSLLTMRFNGRQFGSAIAPPAWAEGRTWFGIHIVSIDWQVGGVYPGDFPVTVESPAIVSGWRFHLL